MTYFTIINPHIIIIRRKIITVVYYGICAKEKKRVMTDNNPSRGRLACARGSKWVNGGRRRGGSVINIVIHGTHKNNAEIAPETRRVNIIYSY